MGQDLNDLIRLANDQMDKWGAECDKTISTGTLENYVEMELSIVTRRYDAFGRLLSETIQNLKVQLRETRENEVSTSEMGVLVCL